MDESVRKPKKARKRTLQDEGKTSTKKAKIDSSVVEKNSEYKVSQENTNFEETNVDNIARNKNQNEFNGQSLRTELSSSSSSSSSTSNGGLNALRKFVIICSENKSRNLAAEYLLAGGSVLEVLKLLDSDKKSISNAITVFSAVNILLVKILAEYPQYQNSTVEACRHLLNSHMSIVYSMLSPQSNAKQRRVVLKMLTAIVSLDNSLSRELLIHLSLQHSTLENLVQHTKPTDPQNVRTCFVHFVLAFLVEGSVPVIRTLLDKHHLLTCIFPDMQYDSRDVVTLALSVIKEYVLENSSINKTTKMRVFSTNVVLNLVSLYNWKGPSNWSKRTKIKSTHSTEESEDFSSEKEIVTNAVHEFLIVLLTSHRHGIIFHDRTLGSSRSKHNQLLHTVLQNLEKPWEHKKPSDLVVKIMVACPDLIRSQYHAVEPFLEPRISAKWMCLVRFVKKIITSIDSVSLMKTCGSELNPRNLGHTLLSLTVPSAVVKSAILPGLDHDDLAVRHEVLTLLLAMFQQVKTIFSNTKESRYRSQDDLTDSIMSIVPNAETILRVWKRALEAEVDVRAPERDIEYPKVIDHLDVILSVLSLYKDVCPELLDGLTCSDPLMLSSLSSIQDDKRHGIIETEMINRVRVKAIRLLLAFDFSNFVPGKETFDSALLFLITLIRRKVTPENFDTIRTLLNATGLFEGCEDQLDIWINGFLVVDNLEGLIPWFVSVLKSAIKRHKRANKYTAQAEKTLNEQTIDSVVDIEEEEAEDIINELFDKANKIPDLSTKIGSGDKSDKARRHDPTYDRKKLESAIDRLLDKANLNNYSFNVINNCDEVSFVASANRPTRVNGQSDPTDQKTTGYAIDTNFFTEFSRWNLNGAVSPLLRRALQKINENNCTSANLAYLSYVTVHTLHYQVVPNLLESHLATNSICLPVYEYLRSWSSGSQPIPLKKKLPCLKLPHKISNMLLTDSRVDTREVSRALKADGDSTCRLDGKDVDHSLSLYDSALLFRMAVFYLAQLAQRGILRQAQNENCEVVLVCALNILARSREEEKHEAEFERNVLCVFTHPILLRYFSPFHEGSGQNSIENMITRSMLRVSEAVVSLYGERDDCEERLCNIFFGLRSKFLTELKNIVETNPLAVRDNSCEIAIAFLEMLQLSARDIASSLLALIKLEKNVFISSDEQSLSVFGRVVPILLDMYCRKSPRSNEALNDQFVKKLSLHLMHLKTVRAKVDEWEEALARYLSIYPCDIAGGDTFALLLTRDITKSTIRLIAVLIDKNTKLIPVLVKYFLKTENAKQRDVVFPILGSNLAHKWNEKFLRRLYKCYSQDIAAYLTEPQNSISWIEENATAIVYLIENTFDIALCEQVCDVIAQSGDKLDMVSVCFVRLLEGLYRRYESLVALKEKPLTDLIMVLLHVATLTLKKEAKNVEKIEVLCEKLDDAAIRLRKIERNFTYYTSLSKSNSWPQFTRLSLKLGLKGPNDQTQINVLRTLSHLCDIAYEDNVDDEYARTLFEMTTSHSEFVNIMLGSSAVKGDLVELLRILTRKNRSVMSASHVPVYLAAYNATLSHVDQRILQILQHYESHNVKIQQYWPYLWGNAAATRYSIKGKTDTALWRQPSTSETFNLFDKDIVDETIKHYPVHRALKDDKLHENSNVYDPAFYLPLLCSLLAENNIVACHRVNQTGALALALASCCSSSSDVRMTAYTVISRYYFHLEASKSKEKLLWMRLIDVLRNGITSFKLSLKDARLSCLATTFLAKVSLIASQPLHPLYMPLQTFLMAKAVLDLNTIPELLQLLHSSHVEHKAHRHWILQNIRDGIKEESDVDVALKCLVFKMLLSFYTSILSDAKTKKLILEVVASATRIPRASLLLMRGYGMLPWLHEIIKHFNIHDTSVDIIMVIIENLLNSLENLTEDTTHHKFMLSNILLRLKAQTSKTQYLIYV